MTDSFLFDEASHVYTLNGLPLPSVTTILKRCGLIDETYYTQSATLRGKIVHSICHLYDENRLDMSSVDERLRGYLEAWIKFRSESGFIPSQSECPMYSKALWFAGTPDKIGLDPKDKAKKWLVDIKTGEIQKWIKYQTVGYEILCNEKTPYTRLGVKLNDDGTYNRPVFMTDQRDRFGFYSLLNTYKIQMEIKNA